MIWKIKKKSGEFFAYGKGHVSVKLVNTRSKKTNGHRGNNRGFYVSITTCDDAALYGDWKEPLSDELLNKVIDYFKNLPTLKSYKDTVKNLNDLIGMVGECFNS